MVKLKYAFVQWELAFRFLIVLFWVRFMAWRLLTTVDWVVRAIGNASLSDSKRDNARHFWPLANLTMQWVSTTNEIWTFRDCRHRLIYSQIYWVQEFFKFVTLSSAKGTRILSLFKTGWLRLVSFRLRLILIILIVLLGWCFLFFFAHRYVDFLLWGSCDWAWGPVQCGGASWTAFFRRLVYIRIIYFFISDVFCLWLSSLAVLVLVNSRVSDKRVEWDKRLERCRNGCQVRDFL